MSRYSKRLINGGCPRFRFQNCTPPHLLKREIIKNIEAPERCAHAFLGGGSTRRRCRKPSDTFRIACAQPRGRGVTKESLAQERLSTLFTCLRPRTRRRAAATVLRAARRRLRRDATGGCACEVCRRPNTVVNEGVRPADVKLTRELTKSRATPAPW